MKKLLTTLAVITAFATIATSCGKDDTKDNAEIPVSEIKVTPATGSVVVGETRTLKAEILPENATDKNVTWASRDESLATVDQEGVVTGVAEGEVQIWATCGDKKAYATLTVTPAPIRVEEVTLSETQLALFVGKTAKLTYTINPENATNQTAEWSSSNEQVATIADDGTVTAIAEGEAEITITVDEKSAVCQVSVSVPEMENIQTPYLKDLTGNTVQMTAEGFKEGDQVNLEDFFGYKGNATVKDITASGAAFDLPADAPKDRSLKITIMREGRAICMDYIRYDDQMVQMAASLGYALTASNEVVDDGSIPGLQGSLSRKGYVKPAAVFSYNSESNTFDAAAADLKLCTFTPTDGSVDLSYVTGAKDLSGMQYFDLTGVTSLNVANTLIEELDMTMFPNCITLLAWGDTGMGEGRFKKVNFGTSGEAPVLTQLEHIQLERNQLSGEIDMRLLPGIKRLSIQDNAITGLNFGEANVDPVNLIESLNAENNQIRELSIENCGQIRILQLKGNPIERLTLLNNSKQEGSNQWMYVFKAQEVFTLSWASAEEAQGERVFNVEHYWWRVYSEGNITENNSRGYTPYDDWVNNGPIVQALKDGVKVICWTYHGEDGQDAHIIHTHNGGDEPCTY